MTTVELAAWSRWQRWATALSIPGALLAIVLWGPQEVAFASVFPALIGATMFGMSLSGNVDATGLIQSRRWAVCAGAGASTAVVSAAVVAAGAISAAAAFTVVTLLALTSPPAARIRKPLLSPRRRAHEDVLRTLTLPELWHAWRESYVALQQARRIEDRTRLVQLRHRLLDEIESRDAVAVHAWLESGARASGEPDAA